MDMPRSKFLLDNVWGEIEITPLALRFVDVYEFQRMRFMKQLGPCNFVYTAAETSRFAHSMGVYHLAKLMVMSLAVKSPKLVTERDLSLIPIAALYHDIGHGPFSHTFDKITGTVHEDRSKELVKYVVDKYNIDMDPSDVEFIQHCIDPDDRCMDWRFQIVSNGDIDVDRMDYLVRDSQATGVAIMFNTNSVMKMINRVYIDENTLQLVYPPSIEYLVDDLLFSRARMYKRVYKHKTALKIEVLMGVAFKAVFDEIANGPISGFLNVSDSILQDLYVTTDDADIRDAIDRIFTRRL